MINIPTNIEERVAFVVHGVSEREIELFKKLDVDRDWMCFSDGVSAWILQTFLLLRESCKSAVLTNHPIAHYVNIVHSMHAAQISSQRDSNLVVVRADYPSVPGARLHIVQNQTQAGKGALWMPHWPQPGMIARDPARRGTVRRVGYFGRSVNHYTRFFRKASGYFRVRDAIAKICVGLDLELVERGPDSWNDFSDIDVVVGHRTFGSETFDTKPPSKLLNAWLAGCVFIGGADSAFNQIGSPGRDYVVASDSAKLAHELEKLRNCPTIAETLIDTGANTARNYGRAETVARWQSLLNGSKRNN